MGRYTVIAIAFVLSVMLLNLRHVQSQPIVIRLSASTLDDSLADTPYRYTAYPTLGGPPSVTEEYRIEPFPVGLASQALYQPQQPQQASGEVDSLSSSDLHIINKRFWPSRASKRKQEERALMVNRLLEEIASLEVEPSVGRNDGSGDRSSPNAREGMPSNDLVAIVDSADIGAPGMAGYGVKGGSASQSFAASFGRSSGVSGGGGGSVRAPKRHSAGRVIPCFFNAITCY